MKILDLYDYGKSSNRRLSTTNKYIQLAARYTIRRLPFDIGVPWLGGKRSAVQQNGAYKRKVSKCDGYKLLSNHQILDEEDKCIALDLVPWVAGSFAYDAYGRFGFLGAAMLESWQELQEQGLIPKGLYLHWGGFWSNKNPKKLGWDLAHYEIRDYAQIIKI